MHTVLLRFDAIRRTMPVAFLLLLLQRTPALQFLVRAGPGPSTMIVNLLRTALVAVAGGAVHTLTGATTFTTVPASPATAPAGTAFTMSFAVTGAPSSPQSYKVVGALPPGLNITGLTAGILNARSGSITGTPTTAGSYVFTIQAWEKTNATGNSSPKYSVTVNVTGGSTGTAPSITAQPASTSVTAGGSASFSVAATGSPAPAYQWQKGGTDITGATSATLSLTNVQNTDAGTYDVVVSNSSGSVTSASATLTVNAVATAPAITSQPAAMTVTAGGSASFTVTATGSPAPTYQWQKGGAAIGGASSASLSLTNVQSSDAGTYSVVVSNSAGSVTSASATLTVNPATAPATAPSITTQPASTTVTAGGNASFSVTATGSPAPTYQWQKGGAAIGGATSASLSLTNVQSSDAGTYSVVVSNSAGSVTSANATLTVNPATTPGTAPSITAQPVSTTVTTGGNASFSVTAAGSPAPTYQWQKGGAAIGGATSASLSLTNVQSFDAGTYSVVVSNSAGSVTSANASLTVTAATSPGTSPSIATQPANLMLPAGYSGSLSVTATGTAPLSYQWRLNGAAIPGATGSTLPLASVQASASGNYSVVVTNASGSVTSNIATVTVGTATGRFLNLSTRGYVGTGNNVLIAGLVVSGSSPKSILIRAVGPALVPMGLSTSEVLADPVLTLKDSTGTDIATNDNWGDAPTAAILSQVFHSVGAFDLTAGSTDSVLLVTLPPGVYTALATGKNGGTGIALLETYEVP